jgi:glycine cleavage system H protein
MSVPQDRRYLSTHEWHLLQGDTVTLGITQFAADELTDITFVDLPKVGAAVKANQRFGEIESVKATSDLYSGVTGTIAAVNDELANDPSIVNTDPHEAGWMIKSKIADASEMEKLLTPEQYLKAIGEG